MKSQNRAVFVLLLATAAGTTQGQFAPGDDPEFDDTTALDRGREMREGDRQAASPVAPVPSDATSPVRPHQPATIEGEGRLLTEGTFVIAQKGVLTRTPHGGWIFALTETDRGELIRPMIVLPSQILDRLTRLLDGDTTTTDIILTGRVTMFHDQNYLFVSAIGETEEAQQQDTEPISESDRGVLSSSVESLVEELVAERSGVRGVVSGLGGADGTLRAPVAEGRTISRRRARFVRLDAGELAVRFDSDAAESPIDEPLVIVPCGLLEDVEQTLEVHGDELSATVSGQTLAYAGRSYILPTSIAIDPPTDIKSRQ